MTDAEIWLLSAVVLRRSLLSALHPNVAAYAFGGPGHGLALDRLTDTLNGLFRRGDLFAERRLTDGSFCPPFVPARHELPPLLSESQPIWYGLTLQGGQRWEEAIRPDWERLLVCICAGESEWAMAASGEGRIHEAMREASVSRLIVSGSVRRERLVPWQATYWKMLPTGYRMTFRVTDADYAFDCAEPDRNWYLPPSA